MPRYLSSEDQELISQGAISARDFMTIYARNRDTGSLVIDSMWSDYGNINASVVNPDTGIVETRSFYGSGNLVSISDIPLVSNLTAQDITVELSQLAANAEALIRQYDVRQSVIQIFRGLFNVETRRMISPAFPRFSGFIDTVQISTPSENEEGRVTLTCASHTREITRSNTATRSHESQKLINPNDTFYKDSASTQSWAVWWGQEKGKVN